MNVLLLHNPVAGREQLSKDELIRLMSGSGCDVHYLPTDDHDLQRRLADAVDLLAIAGGDGTVAKVLAHLHAEMAPVTILPMGTANNLARAMRQVFHDMRPAPLQIRLDGRPLEDELLMLELTKIASLGPRLCIAPNADPGDGFIHVACLAAAGRQAMLDWLDDPEDGAAAPLVVRRARQADVTWHGVPSHLDDHFHEEPGQPCSMRAWLEPAAVKVLVPGNPAG